MTDDGLGWVENWSGLGQSMGWVWPTPVYHGVTPAIMLVGVVGNLLSLLLGVRCRRQMSPLERSASAGLAAYTQPTLCQRELVVVPLDWWRSSRQTCCSAWSDCRSCWSRISRTRPSRRTASPAPASPSTTSSTTVPALPRTAAQGRI